MAGNITNIAVDGPLKAMFDERAKKASGDMKCLCMKFNAKSTMIVQDEEFTTLKNPDEEPDLHDYDNRLAYEKKLFEEMKSNMLTVDSPRFFTWPFYYKSETGCNEKIVIVAWIDDMNHPTKARMIGASGSRALPAKFQHSTVLEVHDADDFNYDELVGKVMRFR